MADQAWPPAPAEPSREEENEPGVRRLSAVYLQLRHRQRRENIAALVLTIILCPIAFLLAFAGYPDLLIAYFIGLPAAGLLYLFYADWRDTRIERVQGEIEAMRNEG